MPLHARMMTSVRQANKSGLGSVGAPLSINDNDEKGVDQKRRRYVRQASSANILAKNLHEVQSCTEETNKLSRRLGQSWSSQKKDKAADEKSQNFNTRSEHGKEQRRQEIHATCARKLIARTVHQPRGVAAIRTAKHLLLEALILSLQNPTLLTTTLGKFER